MRFAVPRNPKVSQETHRWERAGFEFPVPAKGGLSCHDLEGGAAGLLISLAPPVTDVNCRAASIVAKILNGAKPADIPVEQPTSFEVVINLNTAKAMGPCHPAVQSSPAPTR